MLYLNNKQSLSDLFDEMNDMFGEVFSPQSSKFFKADICENENNYTFMIDIPGVKKEDVKLSCLDGYLTVSVSQEESDSQNGEDGKYIRRERLLQSGSRSFYVGEVDEDNIKAKIVDGVLTVVVAKREAKIPEKKFISIE